MTNLSEGFRRLSVFAGATGAIAWLLFALFASEGFRSMDRELWVVVAVGTVIAFFAPWALVRGIGWTVAGFRERR